jgi:aspartyl-tRNA(Asn)/glutamyl-tRNA(Gln) amidotransferase subunit C
MSLSPDQIERLARLARIALGPAEEAAVVTQLNRVLGLIDQMRAVDTAGIEPMSHPVEAAQRQRADIVDQVDERELFQSVAPAVEAGLYLVPKVLE